MSGPGHSAQAELFSGKLERVHVNNIVVVSILKPLLLWETSDFKSTSLLSEAYKRRGRPYQRRVSL